MKNGIQIFENAATKTATIDIDGYIGYNWFSDSENTKERLKKELKAIGNIKADTIIVNINSLGGDVNHGLSIHDLLAEHPAKIITKINGMTASAATIIALAGDERRMSDNALALIHLSSTGVYGNVNDMRTAISDMEVINERIANMYAKAGNKDKQYYQDLMNENNGRGKWIDADEMLDIGLITDKFEPKKMAAYFDFEGAGLPLPPDQMLAKNNINQPVPENAGLWAKIIEFFSPAIDNEGNALNNNQNPDKMNLDELNGKIEDMQKLIDEQKATIETLQKQIAPAQPPKDNNAQAQAPDNTMTLDDLNKKIEDMQVLIENLKKEPGAVVTSGRTVDTVPDNADYMNLDIHDRARKMK